MLRRPHKADISASDYGKEFSFDLNNLIVSQSQVASSNHMQRLVAQKE